MRGNALVVVIGGRGECGTRTRAEYVLHSTKPPIRIDASVKSDDSFGGFQPEAFVLGARSETEQVTGTWSPGLRAHWHTFVLAIEGIIKVGKWLADEDRH